MMKIGMLAGEASGDLLGAGLITELRRYQSDLHVTGVGGSAMIQVGCHTLYDMERLSIMGFIEPLLRLPELISMRRALLRYFIQHKPKVFVGIDSPDFNLGLEIGIRKAGIPVVHYVSPSVWAWRQRRIQKIAKATNLVLTLFPFEMDFYKKYHVPARFVGHPLADLIPLKTDTLLARQSLGVPPDETYIALLPGSRQRELKEMASLMIETAKCCLKKNPAIQFLTSGIHDLRHQEFQEICHRLAPDLPIHFFVNRTHDVMAAANVVLVTSGTATLETMLFKKPMVIVYRMGRWTFELAKRLVKVKFIGLPNLLANQLLVPEFVQDAAHPVALADALLDFLNHPEKIDQLEVAFSELHQQLRCHANQQAALAVQAFL